MLDRLRTDDESIVSEAFEHLKTIFRTHFHDAMIEAGQYIIDTFYEGDHRAALAKNKTKDQPPNLKALIEKIKAQPSAGDDGTPSIGWFYNAVNLAAHEAICAQQGLQTFGILGHSHKLQLLHVPKLKSVAAEDFDATIQSAFQQKEQLAQAAIENNLSVRDFKKYIDEQYSPHEIDLTTIPPIADLRTREPKELVQLYNRVQKKVENSQVQIRAHSKTLDSLGKVIEEKTDVQIEGKGRFQDWTKSGNNVNICTGCENDCIYCYAKAAALRRRQIADGQWPQMRIRQDDVDQPRKLHDGLVGFPSTHDITPTNLDAYLTVLGKLLRAGNEVLIVTKPRLDCIKRICSACEFFKDKILLRFTIGAMDDRILQFWEPNAPRYQERKESLQYAFDHGFRTSVSIEPMLDTPNIEALVNDVQPFITENIWLGTMNHLTEMKKGADLHLKNEIIKIEHNQLPPVLNKIKGTFESNALIKWKSDVLKKMKTAGEKVKIPWEKAIITDAEGGETEVDAPYIISATRRSDIPNYFSDDFMNALRQGHVSFKHMGRDYTVSFEKTRFIVFWTKNPEPLLQHLNEIDRMGIEYYFNYTLNDYDALKLEPHIPPLAQRIATFRSLSCLIGKQRVVWRFDPLILADKISRQDLVDKVAAIMQNVAGYTEKLVISFLDPEKYEAKTKLKKAGINTQEFSQEDKLFICNAIVQMANQHGIQLATCAEGSSALSADYRIIQNKCVDDDLIRSTSTNADLLSFLDKIKGLSDAGQRTLCRCIPSYDVGSQGTCKNCCLYCYAWEKKKNWKDGYVYVSVVQKAIRRCEINLARYYAKQMLELGMPGWLWNRLFMISAEDIGLADPTMVEYVSERYDTFENLRIQKNIKKQDAKNDQQLFDIIDQVVTAQVISCKSRLLPMLSFITLYDIYHNETFSKNVSEYLQCFVDALNRKDERQAVYYATVVDTFMGHEKEIISLIEERSKSQNSDLISGWVKEHVRSGERLMLVGSVVMLCRDINYTHGEYKTSFHQHLSAPIIEEQIPDYAYDRHTTTGKRMGRGLKHFFEVAAYVANERFENSWQTEGEQAYLQAEKMGIETPKKIIEVVKNRQSSFLIQLPFDYAKAVLTQSRTSQKKPYAFIVEFKDGSRKFMKGPFKNAKGALDHVICNEVKRKLESKYLHPIQCEVKEYGPDLIFLECEEIGKADLADVEIVKTEIEPHPFILLNYDSNDIVPNPFKYLTEINDENMEMWTAVMVNYCFRWVFGIRDTASRNLILQKSTGKIYSVDETGIQPGQHELIWGGKKPAKDVFQLISTFVKSRNFTAVVEEVDRWRGYLDHISAEAGPLLDEVKGRIDKFLNDPIARLDV
ncbi:DUF1848 family protein [Desulfatitalea tepidiphila]|uniref:DUF1848 family protein n=1 Tax=Desulfatitalea tepidiphila TaxID=1185843 RepID=UPI0006B55AB5|nr:DUF1848 family protein [Desulfatitalea tepidiphila]